MALPRTPLRMALACGSWCALAACGDPSVLVTVELDGGGAQCIRVVASPTKIDGGSLSTGVIPVADRTSFAVVVFSGPLADGARVVAQGYDTAGCEQLNEESPPATLDFHARAPVTLTLSGSVCRGLAVGAPCPGGHCRQDGGCIDAGELQCGDGLDDDGNGLPDCGEPACLGTQCVANQCSAGDTCQADGGCGGGTVSGSCIAFDYAPSNFNPVALTVSGIAPAITLGCNAGFDTTSLTASAWCVGQPQPLVSVVSQPGGPEVAVLKMQALAITVGNTLTLTGARPAIIAVWGDANIQGTISARSTVAGVLGPGADSSGCAKPGVPAAYFNDGGGGGGGGAFGLAAGPGGGFFNPGAVGAGGAPGTLTGNAALVPLRGGCHGGEGGRGGDPGAAGSDGGSGGGAIQLSVAGQLQLSGVITAGGAGGQQGLPHHNGGGGGGSGGGVLLEGKGVAISGFLTANGGSGAEGSGANTAGAPGTDGSPTTAAPAVMSTPLSADGGNGGNGGAGTTPGAVGETGVTSGGGGGGDVGRIRVNAADGGCSIVGGLRSPPATGGGSCPVIIL